MTIELTLINGPSLSFEYQFTCLMEFLIVYPINGISGKYDINIIVLDHNIHLNANFKD